MAVVAAVVPGRGIRTSEAAGVDPSCASAAIATSQIIHPVQLCPRVLTMLLPASPKISARPSSSSTTAKQPSSLRRRRPHGARHTAAAKPVCLANRSGCPSAVGARIGDRRRQRPSYRRSATHQRVRQSSSRRALSRCVVSTRPLGSRALSSAVRADFGGEWAGERRGRRRCRERLVSEGSVQRGSPTDPLGGQGRRRGRSGESWGGAGEERRGGGGRSEGRIGRARGGGGLESCGGVVGGRRRSHARAAARARGRAGGGGGRVGGGGGEGGGGP